MNDIARALDRLNVLVEVMALEAAAAKIALEEGVDREALLAAYDAQFDN